MRRLFLFVLLCLTGCGDNGEDGTAARTRPLVATTCPPITYIVRALVGEAAEVVCPLPEDADPGHWKPTRDAVKTLSEADLIIYNGARYESWMVTVSLPRARLVDTTADLNEPFITLKEAVTHAHGGGKEHTHSQRDPHTWMDPLTLKQQAAAALRALRKLLPKHDFNAAAKALDDELDNLHAGYEKLGPQIDGEVAPAGHPSYNYLARRYGWRMHNFHFDPKDPLSNENLAQLEAAVEGRVVQAFWWEDTPMAENVEKLKQLGIQSVVVRTGEHLPDSKSFIETMWDNVETLRPMFEDP